MGMIEAEEMWRLQNQLSKCEICNKYFSRKFVFIHLADDLTNGQTKAVIKTLSACINCVPIKSEVSDG